MFIFNRWDSVTEPWKLFGFSNKSSILTKILLGNLCWFLLIITWVSNDNLKSCLKTEILQLYADLLNVQKCEISFESILSHLTNHHNFITILKLHSIPIETLSQTKLLNNFLILKKKLLQFLLFCHNIYRETLLNINEFLSHIGRHFGIFDKQIPGYHSNQLWKFQWRGKIKVFRPVL